MNDRPEPRDAECVHMCAREPYPFEEQFKAMSIEEKLFYLFEQLHYCRRELNVASHRADVMLEHQHDARGQVMVSVHRALNP